MPSESAIELVIALGVPALVVMFYAEGLVVGKLLQPPIVFVAYVAATAPPPEVLTVTVGLCVLAATVGQWTLYRGFDEEAVELFGIRRTVPYLDSLPGRVQDRIGERKLAVVERYFEAYGALGLCVSNAIPGVRGLMTLPAGVSGYPRGRFLAASAIGNGLYFLLLVAAASGVSWLTRLVL